MQYTSPLGSSFVRVDLATVSVRNAVAETQDVVSRKGSDTVRQLDTRT